MNAHDVRDMKICPVCRHPGVGREMIRTKPPKDSHYEWLYTHGICVVDSFGYSQILAFPWAERRKFCLRDTGPDLMRMLIDKGTD